MDKETTSKIQHALDQGLTQKEAAAEANISIRTVSRMIKNGDVQPIRRRRLASPQAKDTPGAEYRRIWSPADLLGIFKHDRMLSIQLLLEIAARRDNWRVNEWIGRIREVRPLPLEWRDAIGFLPILARDIDAPALATLADLMKNEIPWVTKELRNRYRRKATPIMDQALTEIGAWSAGFGLVPLYGRLKHDSPPEFVEIDEAAQFPSDHDQKGNVEKFRGTVFAILIEVVRRLPEVDRPSGNPFVQPGGSRLRFLSRRRAPMAALAIRWCIAVDDQLVEDARNADRDLWPKEPEEE